MRTEAALTPGAGGLPYWPSLPDRTDRPTAALPNKGRPALVLAATPAC